MSIFGLLHDVMLCPYWLGLCIIRDDITERLAIYFGTFPRFPLMRTYSSNFGHYACLTSFSLLLSLLPFHFVHTTYETSNRCVQAISIKACPFISSKSCTQWKWSRDNIDQWTFSDTCSTLPLACSCCLCSYQCAIPKVFGICWTAIL